MTVTPRFPRGRMAIAALAAGMLLGTGNAADAAEPMAYKDMEIAGTPIKNFVASECGGCHQPRRTGATGPNITIKRLTEGLKNDEGEFKTSEITGNPLMPMNEEALFATIKHGRAGTSMPAWGTQDNPVGTPLSDKEIRAVSKYLLNVPAPEKFKWSKQDMADSHETLVSNPPSEPRMPDLMDDFLLATEAGVPGDADSRKVAVIDGDKLEVVTHMAASNKRAHGYTFSPDGRYAYNLGRDGWLYKYDMFALKATKRIRLGLNARGLAISDNGEYLLAGMYQPAQMVVADAHTLEPLKVISTRGLTNPNGETVNSRICGVNDVNSDKVGPYFLASLKEAGQLWRINWGKEGFPVKKAKNVGKILHEMFLDPSNEEAYVASQTSNHIAVVDVESMKVTDTIETGVKPHPGPGALWETEEYGTVAATPHIGEGKATIWSVDDHEIVGHVSSSAPGLFIRTNEHMEHVWFDAIFPPKPNELTVFEKEPPFEKVKVIDEGQQTLHPEADADGEYVFVSDWQGGKIRVYDEETLEKVKTLTDVQGPTGIFSIYRLKEPEGH